MNYIYKNITGNTEVELLPSSQLNNKMIRKIHMTNIHATDEVKVSLYLKKSNVVDIPTINNDWTPSTTNETYYILSSITLPVHGNFVLDQEDILINYKNQRYSLYTKLNNSDSAIDVIIKN